jgi:AraC family transcriptional regulator
MLTDPRGVHDFPGAQRVTVSVHVGMPADVTCHRGGEHHRGRAIHGDIDIIPLGMRSRWVNQGQDTVLVLSLAPQVLQEAVEGAGRDARRLQISNRFQVRDTAIEHLAWAAKIEMERGFPCGRIFRDSLAAALATQLVHRHSSLATVPAVPRGAMPTRRLRQVLSYIEDHLATDLSLENIAQVAGVSVSHCKAQFHRSVGVPVYQYVIRRRVEHAARLLREGELPISQIALESGFSHQSHLARHMRRVLGISPKRCKDACP